MQWEEAPTTLKWTRVYLEHFPNVSDSAAETGVLKNHTFSTWPISWMSFIRTYENISPLKIDACVYYTNISYLDSPDWHLVSFTNSDAVNLLGELLWICLLYINQMPVIICRTFNLDFLTWVMTRTHPKMSVWRSNQKLWATCCYHAQIYSHLTS